jgi:manganese/zinc/iron transport system permease protein
MVDGDIDPDSDFDFDFDKFWKRMKTHVRGYVVALLVLVFALAASPLTAEATSTFSADRQLQANSQHHSEGGSAIMRVITLRDYNTRLVVFSTSLLGLASGWVGTFLLLRKRALMGDALSHACLPGIAIAFMLMVLLGDSGKSLAGLLAGATISGLLGVAAILTIRHTTRIKDDAAMGIILSVFFGLGVVLLGMVQQMPGASAAGLEGFIYGKTASMVKSDFHLLVGLSLLSGSVCLLLAKEFTLLCFDEGFGRATGWPITRLDVILLALVAAVTVVGLQAVGLILIIAFLIIPAAAARFWTDNLLHMLLLAGGIGAISGWLGSSISALAPRLPAGAIIVLVTALIFIVSMSFGARSGLLQRAIAALRLRRKVGRQHLLRAIYELQERAAVAEGSSKSNSRVSFSALCRHRYWSAGTVNQLIRKARREDHIEHFDGEHLQLSESGYGEAARITRNHRLWERFLIEHADIAASHVDRDADSVEHILSPEMVRELEQQLQSRATPSSPHPTGGKH